MLYIADLQIFNENQNDDKADVFIENKIFRIFFWTDLDECSTTTCPSNSQCFNTEGSYECPCDYGYTKNSQGNCEGKLMQTACSIVDNFLNWCNSLH